MTDKFILDLDLVEIVGVRKLPLLGWNDTESSQIYYKRHGDLDTHSQTVDIAFYEVIKKISSACQTQCKKEELE